MPVDEISVDKMTVDEMLADGMTCCQNALKILFNISDDSRHFYKIGQKG